MNKKLIVIGGIVAGILSGCASSNLEVTKCDKKVNGLCVKSHIIKYNKCTKPTKINNAIYCEE